MDFVKLPEAYERRDSLSPFVVFIYTLDLDVIHQVAENIKRNYLTGRQGYLYQQTFLCFCCSLPVQQKAIKHVLKNTN